MGQRWDSRDSGEFVEQSKVFFWTRIRPYCTCVTAAEDILERVLSRPSFSRMEKIGDDLLILIVEYAEFSEILRLSEVSKPWLTLILTRDRQIWAHRVIAIDQRSRFFSYSRFTLRERVQSSLCPNQINKCRGSCSNNSSSSSRCMDNILLAQILRAAFLTPRGKWRLSSEAYQGGDWKVSGLQRYLP